MALRGPKTILKGVNLKSQSKTGNEFKKMEEHGLPQIEIEHYHGLVQPIAKRPAATRTENGANKGENTSGLV